MVIARSQKEPRPRIIYVTPSHQFHLELRRRAEARGGLPKDQVCRPRDRSHTGTAINLLHQGEAKTGVSFRLRGLDPGTNWREPSQTRIFTQVKGRFEIRLMIG